MKQSLKMVIFDMDGTIFKSNIDWREVKKKLDISIGKTILEDIMSESTYNKEKIGILERIERKNTLETSPFNGFSKLFAGLKKKYIKTALITNNNLSNSNYLLNKFSLDFDIVVTREMKMWKPRPDAMKYVFEKLNISPKNTISIGDSDFDIISSIESGIGKIYIKRKGIRGIIEENGIFYFNNYNDLYESLLIALN